MFNSKEKIESQFSKFNRYGITIRQRLTEQTCEPKNLSFDQGVNTPHRLQAQFFMLLTLFHVERILYFTLIRVTNILFK